MHFLPGQYTAYLIYMKCYLYFNNLPKFESVKLKLVSTVNNTNESQYNILRETKTLKLQIFSFLIAGLKHFIANTRLQINANAYSEGLKNVGLRKHLLVSFDSVFSKITGIRVKNVVLVHKEV